jgi:phage terminase large subunit GpA-like protein
VLGTRASSEPGPWRTARTPYLRDVMDALSAVHPARRVVFMKGAQVGATESGNCWLGYIMHHVPAPVLAVQPTVELAKRFSRQRIDPLLEETPALRERVAPARARDAGNTDAVEAVPRRHPGADRGQLGGRAALDDGAVPVPRRGRRLSR